MKRGALPRLDAPIVRARIHPHESVLTRRAQLRLGADGRARVVMALAPGVDPLAPVARARWTDGESGPACRIRPLEHGTSDLARARLQLDRSSEADNRRRDELDRFARGLRRFIRKSWASSNPPIAEWRDALELVRNEYGQLARRELERRVRRASIGEEEERRMRACEVELELVGTPGRTAQLELSFPYAGARWWPSYELRLGEESELVAVAHVQQSTGEPWREVRIELGDRLPHGPSVVPRLPPILVSGFQGPPNVAGTYRSPEAPIAQGPTVAPRVAPGPVDVPGDAQTTRIELFTRRLGLEVRHEVRLCRGETRRIGLAAAPEDLPAGPVTVFDGCDYLGQGRIEGASAGGRISLDLGASPSVRIERSYQRHPPTRSRGTNRLQHRFSGELTLSDRSGRGVDVDVVDHLPIAGSADVEVELLELPTGMTVDPQTGATHALVRLNPGSTRQLRWAYAIHAPRSVVVMPDEHR